jgi:hypothetical protein
MSWTGAEYGTAEKCYDDVMEFRFYKNSFFFLIDWSRKTLFHGAGEI